MPQPLPEQHDDFLGPDLGRSPYTALGVVAVAGYCVGFVLSFLAIVALLHAAASLADEHPTAARRMLRGANFVGAALLVAVAVADDVPWLACAASLGLRLLYHRLVRALPFAPGPLWVYSALVGAVGEHLWWYAGFHWAAPAYPAPSVLGFFLVVVWPVPVGLCCCVNSDSEALPAKLY